MIYIVFLPFTLFIIIFVLYQMEYFVLFSPRYFREEKCDESCEILSMTGNGGVELEVAIYKCKDIKTVTL